jgi:hypothetical protein
MGSGYLGTRQQAVSFEIGPIRPPSEAYSLLIRTTRNCPWNRCQFCNLYKGAKFELRSVEEIRKDIEAARAISDSIKAAAWKTGYGGRTGEVAGALLNQAQLGQCASGVALWLWAGGEHVFLQDSNSLIMTTHDLIQVITFLKESFPSINRITTYGRSHTSARKSLEELKELKDVGLSRIHTGLESGCDLVLNYMQKGITAEQHIRGGRKVVESGISLSEYVMPGLGGRRMSSQHVEETARVLNEINPGFIRLRSLVVRSDMPLWSRLESGDFELQAEDEVVEEIASLISELQVTSELTSDHIVNLLPEVEGKMPEDKEKCLSIISRYLSLPANERLNFRLGRRTGHYEKLADLNNGYKHGKIDEAIERIRSDGRNVDDVITTLKDNFI